MSCCSVTGISEKFNFDEQISHSSLIVFEVLVADFIEYACLVPLIWRLRYLSAFNFFQFIRYCFLAGNFLFYFEL